MPINLHSTFSDIAGDDRFIQDIREAVKNKIFYEDTSNFFTIVPGIKGGQQVAAVRGIEYVTRKSQGCGGNALTPSFSAISQKWEPQLAEVKIKFCYTDFMQKFTQWGLGNGYAIKKLDEAAFFLFIQDLIIDAMKLDMQRLVLFGDEDIASQNILKDASKAEFYDIIKKGLIPTLSYFKTVPELSDKFIEIPENISSTVKISDPKRAIKLMEKLIDTDDFDGNILLTNNALFRNYSSALTSIAFQVLESSKTQMQKGLGTIQFGGQTITPIKNYDRWRKNDFTHPQNGTYLPHFMLFTKKEYLQVGVDDISALDNLTLEYIGGNDEHFYIKANYMIDFKMVNPYEFKAAI